MINKVIKNWGHEEWLVNNDKYCCKNLILNKGFECSTHYHVLKDEAFYIKEGEVKLFVYDLHKLEHEELKSLIGDTKLYLKQLYLYKEEILAKLRIETLVEGEQFRLKPFMIHKFQSVTDKSVILEVSTTHKDEDSYRITTSGAVND